MTEDKKTVKQYLEGISEAFATLGDVEWDIALNPDSDESEEFNRVAKVFMEPFSFVENYDSEIEGYYSKWVETEDWFTVLQNNVECITDKDTEEVKIFIKFLSKWGY